MTAQLERPEPLIDVAPDAAGVVEVVEAPDRPRRISKRTREDNLTLGGALLGALALTWVVYERALPFSGRVGFFVVWFVAFLLFQVALTAMSYPRTVVVDRLWDGAVIVAPLLVALALVSMVWYTVLRGWAALSHVNFYVHDSDGVRPLDPLDHGGLLHAVVGTLIEVGIAVAISLPLGVATAVFMSEVGGKLARPVRTVVEAMTALPSIVAGLFIYAVMIRDLGMEKSGFVAAMALTVMGLPIMARAADVVLRVVPGGLREGSYALGATRWQTVWRVVLPTARPGLATALILGIARMVGETSPVLLTSGSSSYLNFNPFSDPMSSLPLYIYDAVRSGIPRQEARAFGGAAVLLALVLVLFLSARWIARGRKGSR